MNSRHPRKQATVIVFFIVTAIVLLVLYSVHMKKGAAPRAKTPANHVIAQVNGEAIFAGELEAGHPETALTSSLGVSRQDKLNRLIYEKACRHYLDARGVRIDEEVVMKEIRKLRETPPSAGCMCCRFDSLEEYLAFNWMTLDELKSLIVCNKGIEQCLTLRWNRLHPPSGQGELVTRNRPAVEKRFRHMYHVFFNVVQERSYEKEKEKVWGRKKARAQEALAALKGGKPFAEVARTFSEDQMSASSGGDLGCLPVDALGPGIAESIRKLPGGALSPLLSSPWGYHIIKTYPVSDNEITALLKKEFLQRESRNLNDEIRRSARVEQQGQQ